jgi:uncharacterized protein YidB (DUF937 family)
MGLLDDVLKQVGGISGAGSSSPGLGGIFSMVNDALSSHGGVQGLLGALQSGGLADAVNSWIGTGANLPVSADQLQKALGPERLSQIAEQLGVPASQAASTLAGSLPNLIDQLSPDGSLPDAGGLLGKAFDLLKR